VLLAERLRMGRIQAGREPSGGKQKNAAARLGQKQQD
jgi:hypothetical protein